MDTSETYIKMCEQAEEIQKQNAWERCNFYFHPKDGNIITLGEECRDYTVVIDIADGSRFALDDPIIWLPRQDQLQEMIGEEYAINLLYAFHHFYNDRTSNYIHQLTSMEQLWLAFVMKEKYSKVWNSEQWT